MRNIYLTAIVAGMTAVVALAQSSNDVVLLKLPIAPGTKAFLGGREVTDAGIPVTPGAVSVLTVTNAGARGNRREPFVVVRTAAELASYEMPPVVGQDMVRAGSGPVMPMLAGLSIQIDRAAATARAELAKQTAGATTISDETVVTTTGDKTNATATGVMRERTVRTLTSGTISGSRIERVVWCAENGAVNVFVCAPRSGLRPNASGK